MKKGLLLPFLLAAFLVFLLFPFPHSMMKGTPFISKALYHKPEPSGYILLPDASQSGKEAENSPDTDKSGWKLIWHDEFEQGILDWKKWNTENWPAEKNNELQYYRPENVVINEGHLILISKEEAYKERAYTSGAVHTKGKFSFLYGKAEIKAKLPAGQGIFPAFWLLPNRDNHWLPEIDVMEVIGSKPEEVWMVSHWLKKDGRLASDAGFFKAETSLTDNYHVYSVEWTPDQITWLIDGQVRFQSSKHIPKEEMRLYLNTAIGGNWPGSPDSTTSFPQSFKIDYVRVYQKEGGGIH